MSTTTKNVLCRYYMHGACKKGSDCPFSHDVNTPPSMICRYYQNGSCIYGAQCRYDHIRVASKAKPMESTQPVPKAKLRLVEMTSTSNSTAEAPPAQPASDKKVTERNYSQTLRVGLVDTVNKDVAAQILCPFAQAGPCRFGDECGYLHGDTCPTCHLQCLHPDRPDLNEAHSQACLARQAKKQLEATAADSSQGLQCSVCLETVMAKTPMKERRFGLLSDCNHIFCLACIRQWRQSTVANSIVRCCPICRVVSYYVTPSAYWPANETQKREILSTYKESLSQTDCKHFDYGEGECPFGTSCFYRHVYRDGTQATHTPRLLGTATGELQFQSKVSLWDFFQARQEARDGQ